MCIELHQIIYFITEWIGSWAHYTYIQTNKTSVIKNFKVHLVTCIS
jgi:hypothetical protein